MKNKKLDELFQEKFLDFKEMPANTVWRSIEASLDEKKKKRIFPIWWTMGGIAAAFLVTFLLVNPFTESNSNRNPIVNTKKETKSIELKTDSLLKTHIKNSSQTQKAIVERNANTNIPKTETEELGQPSTQKKETTFTKQIPSKGIDSKNQHQTLAEAETATAIKKKEHKLITSKRVPPNKPLKNEDAITNNQNSIGKEHMLISDRLPLNSATAIAENTPAPTEELKNESHKKSIFDEITKQEEEITEGDIANRWSAGPSIAPVYYDAIGEGSPLNSIFVPNSKSGKVNLSYGLSVAYQVSKKLSVRSGIHKVDYGYNTNDITFSSSLSARSGKGQLQTIDYSTKSKTIVISSQQVTSEQFSTANSSLDVSAKSARKNGFMSQQLGYLEIPVELNYDLLNSKFGIKLVGGFSSLLLIDNNVSLTSGILTTEMGEANNVNNLNFSANMGLGLHYRFNPKMRFNIEPIFKYQLNTFSQVDGNFNPYSVGVYSGLTFKF